MIIDLINKTLSDFDTLTGIVNVAATSDNHVSFPFSYNGKPFKIVHQHGDICLFHDGELVERDETPGCATVFKFKEAAGNFLTPSDWSMYRPKLLNVLNGTMYGHQTLVMLYDVLTKGNKYMHFRYGSVDFTVEYDCDYCKIRGRIQSSSTGKILALDKVLQSCPDTLCMGDIFSDSITKAQKMLVYAALNLFIFVWGTSRFP